MALWGKARRERMPAMPLIRLGAHGTVDVVGESNYQDAISAAATRRDAQRDGEAVVCPAVLVPEPDNPHDRNAIRVAIEGRTVGYLSRGDAIEYQVVVQLMWKLGYLGWCPARIVGGGPQRAYGVFLRLSAPECVVPCNDQGNLAICDPEVSVTITQRQHHRDVFDRLLDGRPEVLAFASLHPGRIARGKHAGEPCVEVRIDGARVGEFSHTLSARYIPLLQGLTAPGCEVVVRDEGDTVHAKAYLPRVAQR